MRYARGSPSVALHHVHITRKHLHPREPFDLFPSRGLTIVPTPLPPSLPPSLPLPDAPGRPDPAQLRRFLGSPGPARAVTAAPAVIAMAAHQPGTNRGGPHRPREPDAPPRRPARRRRLRARAGMRPPPSDGPDCRRGAKGQAVMRRQGAGPAGPAREPARRARYRVT